jgi:hypothetical protein
MSFVGVQKAGLAYLPSGSQAQFRFVQEKLREIVSVDDFRTYGDSASDDTDAFDRAADYLNSTGAGGGDIILNKPSYGVTGLTFGNGSNTQPSSEHNKIRLIGRGYGASTGITNQQVGGATTIKYIGSPSSSAAVVEFAGPMYGVGIENIELDCDSKAGRGVIVNHVTMGTFHRVSCRNYTSIGYDLTCRTGFPVGCAYGNGDNRFTDCYGWLDDVSLIGTDILGISLNSGVSTAVSLAGNPDSARNIFIGGTFMYGTTAGSYGVYLSGADNNSIIETLFFPLGGSTLGYDVWLQQWAASGNFPLENYFCNLGMTRGVSGNGGIGSGWGNTFFPFPTSDGATFPALTGASGADHTGKEYVRGQRAYKSRSVSTATLNSSVQSNSTTTRIDVPGLSVTVTTLADSKLRISFSGRVTKSTAGSGNFGIALNGSFQGPTFTDVQATGAYAATSAELVLDVGAGSQTVSVQFQSSDTNAVQISNGSLIVEELY